MHFSSTTTILAALGLALGPLQTLAATADQWRSRSIYQVLTDRYARTDGSTTATCNTADVDYCGGSFQGIESHLDYIQGMGFDAVWISPITAQIEGDTPYGYAYHGYWQKDLYSINSHFGTADDLKSLSQAMHLRGMYLMVDIVVNHNGWNGAPDTVDYSSFTPFNEKSQYHTPYCAIDYSDLSNTTNIEQCWIGDQNVPLPDLRTEDTDVRTTYQTWISGLISQYGIDGLRLDTVIQVEKGFWSGFGAAAGVYMIGEANADGAEYVCNYQNYIPGVMNYAQYFPLVDAFSSTSGSISNLANMINSVKSECNDMSLVGSFSENHDQPRFASLTGDMALARNIMTYTMLADGIPIIYQGQEQHYNALGGSTDPYNREALWFSDYNTDANLYELATTLNKARKQAIADDPSYLSYNAIPSYTDEHVLAVRKGKMTFVTSNLGADGADTTVTVDNTGYAAGTSVTDLLTCDTLTTASDGSISVTLSSGQPRAFYPSGSLGSSGLCGSSDSARDVTSTTLATSTSTTVSDTTLTTTSAADTTVNTTVSATTLSTALGTTSTSITLAPSSTSASASDPTSDSTSTTTVISTSTIFTTTTVRPTSTASSSNNNKHNDKNNNNNNKKPKYFLPRPRPRIANKPKYQAVKFRA